MFVAKLNLTVVTQFLTQQGYSMYEREKHNFHLYYPLPESFICSFKTLEIHVILTQNSSTEFEVSGLLPGSTYTIAVRAKNKFGTSKFGTFMWILACTSNPKQLYAQY